MSGPIARAMAVSCACLLWSALGGCSWMHHSRKQGCTEAPIIGDTRNLPPLKIPPGLDAPDTRTAIKVPALSEPERARSASEPCLSRPPSFKT